MAEVSDLKLSLSSSFIGITGALAVVPLAILLGWSKKTR